MTNVETVCPFEISRKAYTQRSNTRAKKSGQIPARGKPAEKFYSGHPSGSIEIVIGCSFSVNLMKNSVLGKGLLKVGDQISSIFQADRNPDGAWIDASGLQLRCIHSVV